MVHTGTISADLVQFIPPLRISEEFRSRVICSARLFRWPFRNCWIKAVRMLLWC